MSAVTSRAGRKMIGHDGASSCGGQCRCRPDSYGEAESPLRWSETSAWMALERLLMAKTRPAKP